MRSQADNSSAQDIKNRTLRTDFEANYYLRSLY